MEMPQGLYFPGFSAADTNPDMGDSAILEAIGDPLSLDHLERLVDLDIEVAQVARTRAFRGEAQVPCERRVLLDQPDRIDEELRRSWLHAAQRNVSLCVIALEMDGYADYLAYSEELEPGEGDPYDRIFARLRASPGMAAGDLVVLTTATNRFITEMTARHFGIPYLLATVPGIQATGSANSGANPVMNFFTSRGGRSNEGTVQIDGMNGGSSVGGGGVSGYGRLDTTQEVVMTTTGKSGCSAQKVAGS